MRPQGTTAPLATLVSGLVLALVLWTYQARQLWFFMDDWNYIVWRRVVGGEVGLMEPHNEHWVALPTLVMRGELHLFGLDNFLPWVMLPVLLHLITCVLVHIVLRRAGADPWPAVVAALVLAFLGAGAENPLWASQIGSIGAHTLSLAALAVLFGQRSMTPSGRALVWLLLSASLPTMGLSLVLIGWIALALLVIRGVRETALTLSVPAVVYAAWYLMWGRHAVEQPPATWHQAWDFAWTGLTGMWDKGLGIPGLGIVVLAALVLVAVTDRTAPPQLRTLAWAGLLVVAGAFVVIGHSRGQYGPGFGEAPRYIYFGIVLTLPAFALALQVMAARFERPRLEAVVALAALIGLIVVNGALRMDSYTEQRKLDAGDLEHRLVAAVELVDSGAPVLGSSLDSRWAVDLNVARITDEDIRAVLPDAEVTDQGLLDAASNLQVAMVPEPTGAPSPRDPDLHQVSGPGRLASCDDGLVPDRSVPAGGWVDLPATDDGVQVGLVTAGSYEVQTSLLRDGLQSDANLFVTAPGAASYLASVAPDATVRVSFPAGSLVGLCAVS